MSTTRRSRTPSLSSSRAVASSRRRRVAAPRLPSGRPSSATASAVGAGEEGTADQASCLGAADLTGRQLTRNAVLTCVFAGQDGASLVESDTRAPFRCEQAVFLLAAVRRAVATPLWRAGTAGALL